MRIDDRGRTIYENGDLVLLQNHRGARWNNQGRMDHYIGQAVTIRRISYTGDYSLGEFRVNDDDEGWSFTTADIVSLASPELIEKARIEREEKLKQFAEKQASFVMDKYKIFEIAKDVFGIEHVDLGITDSNRFEITILFPEIVIKNSEDFSHTIKDLYFKFDIKLRPGEENISDIHIYGRRGKISNYEYSSNYGHSHFSGDGLRNWSSFCLGSSDFGMIIQSMKFSITEEDWLLLFFSLENYVSWESLEGGPYNRIKSITVSDSVNYDRYKTIALSMFKELPDECFTYTDGGINVIEDHPSLYTHYNANSSIKRFDRPEITSLPLMKLRFENRLLDCEHFSFKSTKVIPELYEIVHENDDAANISMDVCNYFNKILKEEIKKYNRNYDYYKLRTGSTLFREIATF